MGIWRVADCRVALVFISLSALALKLGCGYLTFIVCRNSPISKAFFFRKRGESR
jgi:hypothetical protein